MRLEEFSKETWKITKKVLKSHITSIIWYYPQIDDIVTVFFGLSPKFIVNLYFPHAISYACSVKQQKNWLKRKLCHAIRLFKRNLLESLNRSSILADVSGLSSASYCELIIVIRRELVILLYSQRFMKKMLTYPGVLKFGKYSWNISQNDVISEKNDSSSRFSSRRIKFRHAPYTREFETRNRISSVRMKFALSNRTQLRNPRSTDYWKSMNASPEGDGTRCTFSLPLALPALHVQLSSSSRGSCRRRRCGRLSFAVSRNGIYHFSNATVCNRLVHRFIGPLLRCTFTTAERISLSFQTTFDHTNTSQYTIINTARCT